MRRSRALSGHELRAIGRVANLPPQLGQPLTNLVGPVKFPSLPSLLPLRKQRLRIAIRLVVERRDRPKTKQVEHLGKRLLRPLDSSLIRGRDKLEHLGKRLRRIEVISESCQEVLHEELGSQIHGFALGTFSKEVPQARNARSSFV
jgi:hypothetical protein